VPERKINGGSSKKDVSSAVNSSRVRRRIEERGKKLRIFGISMGVIACLIFMAAGTVMGVLYHSKFIRTTFNNNKLAILTGLLNGNILQNWTPAVQFKNRPYINILVLGVDRDWTNKDTMSVAGARSDSMLVAHIDFANNRITGITIPRDSAVYIPGYTGVHKINAACSWGGAPLSVKTVEQSLDIPIDATVELNISGFQDIVDAIGGIDLYVDKNLNYDDNWGHLHIHLKKGFQHLDGYQAMGFVRIRHCDSDFMRSERQHEFIEALREKIESPSVFLKLPQVIDKIRNQLTTIGLSDDQMLTVANFARQLPKQDIKLEMLPSFEGPSFVSIDADKSAAMIKRIFYADQPDAIVNVNVPSPEHVAELNAPYERGGGYHYIRRRNVIVRRQEVVSKTKKKEPVTDLNSSTAGTDVQTPSNTGTEPPPSSGSVENPVQTPPQTPSPEPSPEKDNGGGGAAEGNR